MGDDELDLDGLADDAAWEAIVRAYGRSIPSRVDALEEALDVARGGGSSLEAPRRLAHRLHGTAGSYGLDDVSAAAGRLEDELLAAEAAGAIDAAAWARIDDGVAHLRTAAAAAARGAEVESAGGEGARG